MLKKCICLFIIIAMVFGLSACSGNAAWQPKKFNTKTKTENKSDFTIAENQNLRLEWVKKTASVNLVDKATGTVWGITPSKSGEPEIDEYGMPIKKHPQAQSAIIVEYLRDEDKQIDIALAYTNAVTGGRVKTKAIKNGIRVEYYFDSVKIMVPVEFVLRSDSVAVTINPKQIQENTNKVVRIAIAPFWCSAENDAEDSYLFVPSGSGSLISCNKISAAGASYSSEVYGQDESMDHTDLVTTKKETRLPVYGAKYGDKATCAIIENAAASATINATVGSTAIKYSSVYASYQIRGYTSNVATLLNDVHSKMDIYAEKAVATAPMTIGFYPLVGDNANYSGMAQVYKNYLKKSKAISKNKADSVLGLTFVGGAMINRSFLGIPYKDLLAATTIQDVMKILEDVSSKTDAKIHARLLGFGVTGINISKYAGGFKMGKKFGSKKDLAALIKMCDEKGIELYFDFDVITLGESSAGYNTLFDTAYNACYKTAHRYAYDVATKSRLPDYKFTILSRELLPEGSEKLMKKIAKYKLPGVSLSTLTNMAYSDYSDKENSDYYSKGKMEEDATKILNQFSQKYNIAASDANAYAAVLSDMIYDVSTVSSKENVFLCDVPFYQMVFKGYVPMSSESMNLVANPKQHLLRTIETGTSLGYTLTASYSNKFIDQPYQYFFGTQYYDMDDRVTASYNDLKDYYKAINSSEIVKHTIHGNGLRETVYANGVKVYVNNTSQSVMSPLGEIEALNYKWGR